jgi:hypothetical protein
MNPPLTPAAFDAIASNVTSRDVALPRVIWTLPAIGLRIGRGRDFAAAMAKMPGSPIRRVGRQFCVEEHKLMEFIAGNTA